VTFGQRFARSYAVPSPHQGSLWEGSRLTPKGNPGEGTERATRVRKLISIYGYEVPDSKSPGIANPWPRCSAGALHGSGAAAASGRFT